MINISRKSKGILHVIKQEKRVGCLCKNNLNNSIIQSNQRVDLILAITDI